MSRSHVDSFFFPCGMRMSADTRQSSNIIRLLDSASPGITIGPNLVPFISPSYEVRSTPLFWYPCPPGAWQLAHLHCRRGNMSWEKLTWASAAHACLGAGRIPNPISAETDSAPVASKIGPSESSHCYLRSPHLIHRPLRPSRWRPLACSSRSPGDRGIYCADKLQALPHFYRHGCFIQQAPKSSNMPEYREAAHRWELRPVACKILSSPARALS